MRKLSKRIALVSALLIVAASLLGGCISISGPSGSMTSSPSQQPAQINTIGNTPGNLSNYGLAAQQGDWIYYSTVFVNGGKGNLYKIRTDGTGKTKLIDGRVLFINVVGDWIYYVNIGVSGNNYDLYKIRTDGTGETKLSNSAFDISVVGDWIYYLGSGDSGSTPCLRKIRTDGSGETKLGNDLALSFYVNISVVDDWIYYVNKNDSTNFALYKIRKDGTQETMILSDPEQILSNNVVGDWIYYVIGPQDGYGDFYKIRTDGTGKTKLSNDKIAFINVVGDWIYYSARSDNLINSKTGGMPVVPVDGDYASSLCKIRTDGTSKTELYNGETTVIKVIDINVVGDWIYYSNGDSFNKIRTDSTENQKVD
jgi:hypothetical protein